MQGRCRNPCCPVCEDKSWQAPLQPKGLKPVPVRGRSSPGQSEAPPWVTSIHKKSPVRATLPRRWCCALTGLVIGGDQLPRAALRSALGFTARLKAGRFQPFGLKALETYCRRPPDHKKDYLRAARKKTRTLLSEPIPRTTLRAMLSGSRGLLASASRAFGVWPLLYLAQHRLTRAKRLFVSLSPRDRRLRSATTAISGSSRPSWVCHGLVPVARSNRPACPVGAGLRKPTAGKSAHMSLRPCLIGRFSLAMQPPIVIPDIPITHSTR